MLIIPLTIAISLLAVSAMASSLLVEPFRCIMYLTGQHNVVPENKDNVKDVTHVNLAFMRSEIFNVEETPSEFPLFTTIDQVRTKFSSSTKVLVAIGGWGNSEGFEIAARNESNIKRWTGQVANMVKSTGADGVDIDWEYPGGNRDDYKIIPNSERVWEIEAFVQLLTELRMALGPKKIISAAVPGKECDLMAFTPSTIPRIMKQVDFLSIMTYDLMNRRDNVTKHHSGVSDSREAMQRYISRGAPADKLNLGFGYYTKWFKTVANCDAKNPLGCPTEVLEDPETGADTGKAGAFSWHDTVPEELASSWTLAQARSSWDDGSRYFWDPRQHIWWSFDLPSVIGTKFAHIVHPLKLGGVFAWGLGEDAPSFRLFGATIGAIRESRREGDWFSLRDEL